MSGISSGAPAIAFDGTHYLVVWQRNGIGSDIYGSQVYKDGTVPGEFAISTAVNGQWNPALSFEKLGKTEVNARWQKAMDRFFVKKDPKAVGADVVEIEEVFHID